MLLGRFTQRKVDRRIARTVFFPVAVFALFAAALVLPKLAHAAGVDLGLQYATATGLSTRDIRSVVGTILKAFFGFLGMVALILILYAGFLWMTAGGNEEKVTTAKRILINATIGLIIMMSAFAITQFIFGAILGTPGPATSTGSSAQAPQLFISGGSGALGSGIIDYHYPEAGQTGVPRNTRIAVTFKKPIALSTIIQDYDDKDTIAVTDDVIPAQLLLNTQNIKLVANEDLQPGTGATPDAKFDSRYTQAIVTPPPTAKVTVVTDPALGTQTLVISLVQPIGSPTADVNYRVALRGGAIRQDPQQHNVGVQVWGPNQAGDDYKKEPAFSSNDADGGYYWTFTTNTTIDVTPPQILAVVPYALPDPSRCNTDDQSCVYRNQLMQVYFSEAVDPTTASGVIGAGGGFNNIDFKAKCRGGGLPCDPAYNNADFSASVSGTLTIGNRYRTVEFLPNALCEGVAQNSCGEPVYCLPANVQLKTLVKAADVGTNPPQASADNGVEDMVGNSLDGNNNEKADGPASATKPNEFSLNTPQANLAAISDNAAALYFVGDAVDLVPPTVINVDPPSTEGAAQQTPYAQGGSSKVPVDLPIAVTWSKIMSITSIRTGKSTDPRATFVLDASECKKVSCATTTCTCTDLDDPSFFVESQLLPPPPPSQPPVRTKMLVNHRLFFTANDLGYTEAEVQFFPRGIPKYVPALRAKLKDDKQNCFFPSRYEPQNGACAGLDVDREPPVGSETVGKLKTSCCNKTAMGTYSCPP